MVRSGDLNSYSWAYALRWIPAGRLAATTYAVPVISLLAGWMILGQIPASLQLAGGALTLAGVAVSRMKALWHGPVERARL